MDEHDSYSCVVPLIICQMFGKENKHKCVLLYGGTAPSELQNTIVLYHIKET